MSAFRRWPRLPFRTPDNPMILNPTVHTGWTPANKPPAAWYRAKEYSTLTIAADGVSAWADHSGNSNTLSQSVGANRLQYSATAVNGKPGLVGSGAQNVGRTASNLLRNVGGVTVCAAVRYDNNASIRTAVYFSAATSGATRLRIQTGTGTSGYQAQGRRLDADSTQTLSANTFSAGVVVVETAVLDYANSNAYLYINGSLANSTLSWLTDGATSDTASAAFSVGAAGSAASPAAGIVGAIGEVIVWPSVLNAAELAALHAYMATEWL